MPTSLSGDFLPGAKPRRIAIAASRFNAAIVELLVGGAVDALVRHGVKDADITVVRVPGAWELPLIVQKLAASGRFDGIVALGCVIRGETPHFDYVAGEAAKGVAAASLATGRPVTFGVLTTDTVDQAQARAGGKAGNKGAESAVALIEMLSLLEKLG